MATRTPTIEVRRVIQAPPAEVFRALTRPSLLRDWMCQDAQADARKGGRLYFWWSSGYSAAGEFTVVDADKKLTFTWLGKKDPGPSRVTISLAAQDGGTEVRVRQIPPGRGPAAARAARALTTLWDAALFNLQSLLETGEDPRYTRRPMLGVNVGVFGPEEASKLGVPVKEGVRLDGVVKGMGAEGAGLGQDDVVVSIGGQPIRGWNSLAPTLGRFRAGDAVPVVFYRGSEKRTTMMTLSGRPLPAIPPEPKDLAAQLRRISQGLMQELRDSLRGISDEHAGRRPGPGEWSAKHVLAHLIAGERDNHGWMAEVLEADDPLEAPGNVAARIDAMVDTFGTAVALLEELERNYAITARMVESLPPQAVARKQDYWKIGHNLLQPEDHVRGHIQQMVAALKAAGGT